MVTVYFTKHRRFAPDMEGQILNQYLLGFSGLSANAGVDNSIFHNEVENSYSLATVIVV
jgi:hypothetical protein